MTREELLAECFGRSDFAPPNRMVELTEGRDVVSLVDIYLRRLLLRYDGDFAAEGRGVDASTTLTVATLENVCTDPARRGKGCASAMVRRALSELRENRPIRYAVVRVEEDERPFWERLGFVQVEAAPALLVYRLRDEPWPRGRVRLLGDWPS